MNKRTALRLYRLAMKGQLHERQVARQRHYAEQHMLQQGLNLSMDDIHPPRRIRHLPPVRSVAVSAAKN